MNKWILGLSVVCGVAWSMPIIITAVYVSEMMKPPKQKPKSDGLYIVNGDSVDGIRAASGNPAK